MDLSAPTQSNKPEEQKERMVRLAMALLKLGVSVRMTRKLLYEYDLDVIERQLKWLPRRRAVRKAAYIVVAIQEDYLDPIIFSQ